MADRYFVHDLETDKLLIYTGGKADWLSLPEADRNEIKRCCLWSNSRSCWVNRCKGAYIWCHETLKRLGFEDRGTDGERLSFAAQVEAKQEKAEARAERMEDRAQNAAHDAQSRFKAAHDATAMIPMGQPILVGHHSEKRHRAALARSDNNMRKGCEASDKAEHYQRRAEASRETADGAKYSDPGFLGRRIKEAEAEERGILRRLDGEGLLDPSKGMSDGYRERLERSLAEVQDKLGFYRHCLATCGREVFSKETLKGKKFVKVRGRWEEVARLNQKTVSVLNLCFPTRESQAKWPLKYLYAEVQEAREGDNAR